MVKSEEWSVKSEELGVRSDFRVSRTWGRFLLPVQNAVYFQEVAPW